MISATLVAGGLVLLVAGADALVRGAVGIAVRLSIPSLVIGLTVVAFGTSAPELAMGLRSVISGDGADVALGNVVGSSISNILVILGVTALFGVITVSKKVVRVDVPILLLVTGAVWWIASDGLIGVVEGVALLVVLIVYIVFVYVAGRRESYPTPDDDPALPRHRWGLWGDIGLVVVGLVTVVIGADLTVDGATRLASALGVSDLMIGLTIVAVGTSLPELVTCVVALKRGESDLAVGNVIGSNLFNFLGVLGLTAVVGGGIDIPDAMIRVDLPLAFVVTLVALPALASGLIVQRWEGAVMLFAYCVYVAYLVIDAGGGPNVDLARVTLFLTMATVALVMFMAGMLRRDQPLAGP